jgi:cytochrome P450 family 2 subfamily K
MLAGIMWVNGEQWKKVRRFSQQTMRDFGVGKKSLEEIILDETRLLGDEFASREDQPISNVKHMMMLSICNIIHHIVFGFRLVLFKNKKHKKSVLSFLHQNKKSL